MYVLLNVVRLLAGLFEAPAIGMPAVGPRYVWLERDESKRTRIADKR